MTRPFHCRVPGREQSGGGSDAIAAPSGTTSSSTKLKGVKGRVAPEKKKNANGTSGLVAVTALALNDNSNMRR